MALARRISRGIPSGVFSIVRRRRRTFAALAAGLATALALLAILPRPQTPAITAAPAWLAPGEVAVPVAISLGADLLQAGDTIDLVDTSAPGAADVVAERARVLNPPGGLASSTGAVLVAVDRDQARRIAAAGVEASLTAWIVDR